MTSMENVGKKGTGVIKNPGIIVVIAAFLLYFNTLSHDYVYDDYLIVVDNIHIEKGFSGIKEVLTTNYAHGRGNDFNDGLYRPLSLVMFAIEYQLFGENPFTGHLINLILYALGGLFLFRVLQKTFPHKHIILPLSISLLYIAHPIHTEVVANIKSRDEILVFLNVVLSLFFILEYFANGKLKYIIYGLLFYTLALLSKENAITFLVLIPLFLLLLKQISLKKQSLLIFTMAALSIAWYFTRQNIIESMPRPPEAWTSSVLSNIFYEINSLSDRLATAAYMQLLYIQKLVFPNILAYDYSYNQIPVTSMESGKALIGMGLVAILLIISLINFKRNKVLAFAILFYFISIAVVSNVFITIGATFAERFLFTPSFAIALITGWFLYKLKKTKGEKGELISIEFIKKNLLFVTVLAVILLLYSFRTITRNTDWEDNLSLYSADIGHLSNSARANYNLGTAIWEESSSIPEQIERKAELQKSAFYLSEAIRIYPYYKAAYNNLGVVYSLLDKHDSVIILLTGFLNKYPSYYQSYLIIASAYNAKEQYDNAAQSYEKYLNYVPDDISTLNKLAVALGFSGDFEGAVKTYEKTLKIDPGNFDALLMSGKAYGKLNNFEKANEFFIKALKRKPKNIECMFNIGITYMNLGDFEAAKSYFERILTISPGDQNAIKFIEEANRKIGEKLL